MFLRSESESTNSSKVLQVSTSVSVSHDVATPVGEKLRAISEVIAVNGRTIRFATTAFDQKVTKILPIPR